LTNQKTALHLHTDRSVFGGQYKLLIMNDTRDFIIDEAYKLFLTQSYEAVSISTISDAIGLTKGALYHHFTNKEDLFKAVIDKHFPSFLSKDGRADITVKEVIEICAQDAENVLRSLCPKDMKFNPISFIGIMSDAFRHYSKFAKSKLNEIDTCINRLRDVVVRAIDREEIRSDIDPTIVAKQLFSTTLGTATEVLHNHTIEETVNNLRAELNQFYALLKK